MIGTTFAIILLGLSVMVTAAFAVFVVHEVRALSRPLEAGFGQAFRDFAPQWRDAFEAQRLARSAVSPETVPHDEAKTEPATPESFRPLVKRFYKPGSKKDRPDAVVISDRPVKIVKKHLVTLGPGVITGPTTGRFLDVGRLRSGDVTADIRGAEAKVRQAFGVTSYSGRALAQRRRFAMRSQRLAKTAAGMPKVEED